MQPLQPCRATPPPAAVWSAAAASALLTLVAPARGQLTWVPVQPAPRSGHAMAFDPVRQRVIVNGGSTLEVACSVLPSGAARETWEWDGARWEAVPGGSAPCPLLSGHAMVTDSARRRVVAFGASPPGSLARARTLEWDGASWTELSLAINPPARSGHAMAWDARRRRVVLFGGIVAFSGAADTWEFDGTSWTQKHPASSPPPMSDAAMAYDTARDRSVLVGRTAGGMQTWEWDGSDWTAAAAPPAVVRSGHAVVWVPFRQRTMLFGGGSNQTWEWDGTTWTRLFPPVSPPAKTRSAMAYDPSRGRVVLFSGDLAASADTWEWDGTTWLRVYDTPATRQDHAMAFDEARGETLLFGGRGGAELADTWSWDGSAWSRLAVTTRPPAGIGSEMVYDSARRRIVLYHATGETWEWEGKDWKLVAAPRSPGPRLAHALAFDRGRGRTVLFGGRNARDTWEYDGTSWTRIETDVAPGPRWGHAMAYHEAQRRVVLFGGQGLGTLLADTWEWDGTTWWERRPPGGPPAQDFHSMGYDRARQRVVLLGGDGNTWEWDGNTWTARSTSEKPFPRAHAGMAYDDGRGRVAVFGGAASNGRHGDLWELVDSDVASYRTFGSGCPGSAGAPTLAARTGSRPALGRPFTVVVGSLPANPLPVAMYLGFSRRSWGPYTLPLDLGPIGMPGCALRVSPDVTHLLGHSGSTARWTTTICVCPGLIGADFFNQALVLDARANVLGVTVSNAGHGTIGF